MRRLLPGLALTVVVLAACRGGSTETLSVDAGARGSFPDTASGTDWPGWGGPGGDFKVDARGLVDRWPDGGPPVVWSRPLGPGYATVAAARGVLVTAYREGDDDIVTALRADDGREVWRHRYASPAREGQDTSFGSGPNATPLVTGGRVFALSFAGFLNALDLVTGEPLWRHDLVGELGGEVLMFGNAASPIEHAGRIVVLAGGAQAVIAFDAVDGAVAWKSAPGSISYATPKLIDVDGRTQLVYLSADRVVGLDPSNGKWLWDHPCENQYRNNATGVQWGPGNLLWVATQLDGGARALRLGASGAEEVWFNNQVSIHFWGSLLLDQTVYASIGDNASVLAGIDLATGAIRWRERDFTRVTFVHAGDRTLLLDEEGGLSLVRLRPDGVEVLARATIVDRRTWSAPTLLGTRLYVRDERSIRALELAAPGM